MPHVENYKINGVLSPSVNDVTELIPKPWLMWWYRKVGFKAAEEIRDTAVDRGLMVHKVFENYFLNVDDPVPSEAQPYLDSLNEWVAASKFQFLAAEPHLVSTQYMYHGSPDLLGLLEVDGQYRACVLDFKIKTKYPDYRTIINEAAYAQMWYETHDSQPIDQLVILRFDPATGQMLAPLFFKNEAKYFRDFLVLRKAYDVSLAANKWDSEAKKQDKKGV